jgi:hypothetical protein
MRAAKIVATVLLLLLTTATATVAVAFPDEVNNVIATVYHGNTDSKIFHGPGCRHYNCGNCTASFQSRDAAIAAGYRACRVCDP